MWQEILFQCVFSLSYLLLFYFQCECFYYIHRLFWNICNRYFKLNTNISHNLQCWQVMLNLWCFLLTLFTSEVKEALYAEVCTPTKHQNEPLGSVSLSWLKESLGPVLYSQSSPAPGSLGDANRTGQGCWSHNLESWNSGEQMKLSLCKIVSIERNPAGPSCSTSCPSASRRFFLSHCNCSYLIHGSPKPDIIRLFLDKLFVPRLDRLGTKMVLLHFLSLNQTRCLKNKSEYNKKTLYSEIKVHVMFDPIS